MSKEYSGVNLGFQHEFLKTCVGGSVEVTFEVNFGDFFPHKVKNIIYP